MPFKKVKQLHTWLDKAEEIQPKANGLPRPWTQMVGDKWTTLSRQIHHLQGTKTIPTCWRHTVAYIQMACKRQLDHLEKKMYRPSAEGI
jgi:hypothetical protein